MKLLSTDFSWGVGDLFNRFQTIFMGEVGDGSSLVFTKLDFWLFFLLVMLVFSFLHKHKVVRSIFLSVVSLFFFYKTSGLYMLLLLISVTVNYGLGNRIFVAKKESSRKWIIAFSAIFNLLILGYFKYAYFFTDSFNQMFHTDFELVNHFAQFGNGFFGEGTFVEKILLPVGVSFFTFQNISYVVDIYRKEIEPVKNFFHYSFFVTFFPQLVMGPIVRARDFIPQIKNPFYLNKDDYSWAVIQITKGLVKKIVIADFLVVHFIDKIVLEETYQFATYPGFVYVIAMWAYSLHIYADFSGYTDIAIGLSRLMGFKLKPNFNSPYKAISVADFWRRWHMSLGSWLKDYLYIPLGGNRTGGIGSYIAIVVIFVFLIFITQWWDLLWIYAGLTVIYLIGVALFKNFRKYVHRDLNLIITMVMGGLWHGASENFVIWGAMNGAALVVFKYWSKIRAFLDTNIKRSYFVTPVVALALYIILFSFYPRTYHPMFVVFFVAWVIMNFKAFIFHSIWNYNYKVEKRRKQLVITYFSVYLIGFGLFMMSLMEYPEYYGLYPDISIEITAIISAIVFGIIAIVLFGASTGRVTYEKAKKWYKAFWQVFITFNFITFTRIWFKLDEARMGPFKEAGLSDSEADELPFKMLDRIWNHFEFTWEYFLKFIDMFQVPLIILIVGMIIHWLPNKVKGIYEKAFTAMPLPLQAICIGIIVFLMYQALGAEQPAFVYLQF